MLEKMVTETPANAMNTAQEVANPSPAVPACATEFETSQAEPSTEVFRLIRAIWFKHSKELAWSNLDSKLKYSTLEGFAEVARAYGQTFISMRCWERKLEVGTRRFCKLLSVSDASKVLVLHWPDWHYVDAKVPS